MLTSTDDPRHRRRGLGVLAALGLMACSAVHELAPPADPATVAQLDALAAKPGTTAEVSPLPGPSRLVETYDVSAATAKGLTVSFEGGPPMLISYDRVQSLARVDREHGARNGAIIAGIPAFLLGFIFGKVFDPGPVCQVAAGGSCPPRTDTTVNGLKLGGTAALLGIGIGAAAGALVGYEDRYFIVPTETASAR
jgi:hypothetical protein